MWISGYHYTVHCTVDIEWVTTVMDVEFKFSDIIKLYTKNYYERIYGLSV